MCRFTGVICLLLMSYTAQSQLNIDSLTDVFFTLKANQKKYVWGHDLFFKNVYSKPQTAKRIAMELKSLGLTLGREVVVAQHFNTLGIYYDVTSNRDSALWAYRKALVWVKDIDSHKIMTAGLYNNLGLIHAARGKNDSAIFYYKMAMDYGNEDDLRFQGNISHNIGLVLEKQRQFAEAGNYLFRALRIGKKRRESGFIGALYHAISDHHSHLKDYDSAWYYNSQSIVSLKKANDKFRLAMAYHNRATYFERLSTNGATNTDSLLFYMRQSLKYKLKLKDGDRVASSAQKMAQVYAAMSKLDSAWKYIEMARVNIDSNNLPRYSAYLFFLGKVQLAAGLTQKAVWTTRKASVVSDSALAGNYRSEVAAIQEALNIQVKEMEIKALAGEKKLSEEKRKSQQYLIIGLAVLFVLMLVLIFIWYNKTKLQHRNAITQKELEFQEGANRMIIDAQEEERNRIAGDLHDDIGQQLTAIRIEWFNFLRRQSLEDESLELRESFTNLAQDIRNLSHQMMPKALKHLGLVAAIEDLLHKVKDKVGIEVELDFFNLQQAYNERIERSIYRIIQECVSNALKHSEASLVSVQLYEKSGNLTLMVEDNGRGMNSSGTYGAGLLNIEARVKLLKGNLNIESEPGEGTVIFVKIPLV